MASTTESAPDPQNTTRAWARELQPNQLLPKVTLGLLIGVIEVVFAISAGALIFGGPLSAYTAPGIGLVLVSAMFTFVTVALLTTIPGVLAGVQDTSVAIIAVVAATIAATVATPAGAYPAYVTVVTAMGLSTLATGSLFLVLGYFRLGNLAKFVPYPVVGGFIAGTGWLLLVGAFGLMVNLPTLATSLLTLVQPGTLLHLLPGILLALALAIALRRSAHPLVMPAVIVCAIALFYLVALLTGTSIPQLSAQEWLLGPFPSGALWQPLAPADLRLADWGMLAEQAPSLLSIALLSTVGLLINASSLEASTKREVHLNRELRAASAGNLLAGLVGGLAGYQALGYSLLVIKSGRQSRLIGIVAALVCLVTLIAGSGLLALFPKFVAGGLLLYMGFELMKEWLYDAWFRLPKTEYAIVLSIVVVIAGLGFMPGLLYGVLATIIMFVLAYSRVDVVRNEFSGQQLHSRVTRSAVQTDALNAAGAEVYILRLQGFIFFGTADRLVAYVQKRLAAPNLPPPRFVLLDFKRVTGLDTTGVANFMRLREILATRAIYLLITDAGSTLRAQLERGGLPADSVVAYFSTEDKGLEWCENALLEQRGIPVVSKPAPLRAQFLTLLDGAATRSDADAQVDVLMHYLDCLDVTPGTCLIRQGDVTDCLYFIEHGLLTVQLERPTGPALRVETLSDGRTVGEVGFFLKRPRNASVIVDAPTTVYRLTYATMARIEQEQPEAATVLRNLCLQVLARRVVELNGIVRALE